MHSIFKTVTAAAALTAALASTAAAQDAEQWEGFYAGARVNMNQLDVSGSAIGIDPGFNAGIFGGYNHAVGSNFILGGELSYDSESSHDVFGPINIDLENNIGVRARGGYTFGNSMLYATAGYAWSDWNVGGLVSGSGDGFVYGVGLETLLTENISTRFEYTRTDMRLSGGGVPSTSADINTFSVGLAYKF